MARGINALLQAAIVKVVAAAAGPDARSVGGILLQADGTLGVSNRKHALLLLLQQRGLQHSPLLQKKRKLPL